MVDLLPALEIPAPLPRNPALPAVNGTARAHGRPEARRLAPAVDDGWQPAQASTARILIAGDHPESQRVLRISLKAWQYEVTAARTGREAIALAASSQPDAIILDLSFPDMDGTEVITSLRRWYTSPVLAVLGRTSPADKISALDAGADHYMTKPIAMDELLARLRAALRRYRGDVVQARPLAAIGRWQVDLAARQVTCFDTTEPAPERAETLRLTPTEWAILETLLNQPGKLVETAQLMNSVWGPGFERRTSYLRFHMTHLRRKLEDDPAQPQCLLTQRGLGYRYQPAAG